MKLEELKDILEKYDISTDEWRTESYKTIDNLLLEINNKDCYLTEHNGKLLRNVNFVSINILYIDDVVYKLIETKQVFNDDRVRVRKLQGSVAEKMLVNENPIDAAIRGIKEELDIDINKTDLKDLKYLKSCKDSLSYPNLKCNYSGHRYTYILKKEYYNKNGYTEVQDNLTTFFEWQEFKTITQEYKPLTYHQRFRKG